MGFPRLKGKRTEMGISQSEMAKKIGIETSSYNAKELGKRSFTIKEILLILNVLQCKFEDIF